MPTKWYCGFEMNSITCGIIRSTLSRKIMPSADENAVNYCPKPDPSNAIQI
jgi:hypothetical protein